MLIWRDDAQFATREFRPPAPAPGWPASPRDWSHWSRKVDAYLQDHFAFRHWLVTAYSLARYELDNGNGIVLIGRGERLFYLGDEELAQSAGQIHRPAALGMTVVVMAELKAALEARHAKLIVAFPPNASTIETGDLPTWARPNGRVTEYDELLAGLSANGIKAVDLRPALLAARSRDNVYFRQDTHWTWSGVIAGFNAIVAADGHPDWRIPSDILVPGGPLDGDITRMLGLGGMLKEPTRQPTLAPDFEHRVLRQDLYPTYVDTADHPGLTIMVLGDSFTVRVFEAPIMQHAARLVWAPADGCGFDWSLIDRFHPDEVWYVPTERYAPCISGQQPRGMPTGDRLVSTANGFVARAPTRSMP